MKQQQTVNACTQNALEPKTDIALTALRVKPKLLAHRSSAARMQALPSCSTAYVSR